MSCAECPITRVEHVVRTEESLGSEKDPSQEIYPDTLDSILEQSIWRLVKLHEDTIEQQEKQCKALQSQLQSFQAEHASVRALLKQQQEQILQNLSAAFDGTDGSLNANNTIFEAQQGTPEAGRQVSLASDGEKLCEENNTLPMSDVPKAFGNSVLVDADRLPKHWSVGYYGVRHATSGLDRVVHFIKSDRLDAVFTVFIFVNLLTMFAQLQWRGYHSEMLMGYRADDHSWQQAKPVFETLEVVYTSIFFVESLIRIIFNGWDFLRAPANLFDTLIVLATCAWTYILQPLGLMDGGSGLAVARLIRLLRVLRLMKVVRFTSACTGLRILVKSTSGCFGSLFWSMLMLGAIITSSALVLFHLVVVYLEDESNPIDSREWAYEHVGSISLCLLTLWESTFTGSWFRFSRPMIVGMNPFFATFWVPYIICINFAVMRIIGALFLKETMEVASRDDEKMTMSKLKRKHYIVDSIRQIFIESDTNSDGKISADEFEEMLHNERVGILFEALELEVPEIATLFELLAADDGMADYDEFLSGALKLKQHARTIDMIQLLHGNIQLIESVRTLYHGICDIATSVGTSLDKTSLNVKLKKAHTHAHDLFLGYSYSSQ